MVHTRRPVSSARAPWLLPCAGLLVALAACMQTTQYVAIQGPQPAPCTDSIAARVARLPAESVTVADREHALWAQAECKVALDSMVRAARQAQLAAASQPQAGPGAHAEPDSGWPPPACKYSIATRVAHMPKDSVSAADLAHAAVANRACELALETPPPPAANPASINPQTTFMLAAVAVVAILLLF